MGKSIAIIKFFSKDKMQNSLEVNIDDVTLSTLKINIPIF